MSRSVHSDRLIVGIVCAFLTAIVWIASGPVIHHDFVDYDDGLYVYENPKITNGLTLSGILWAFTHVHADNWHPLTTLSHMLDCQLYGLQPWGHHLTNILLHAAAAILLFLALRKLTNTLWLSAFVAALFAIHPLRVESVAWISERKDVLSGVFFMLTLLAYAHYAQSEKRSFAKYTLVLVSFALGLLCKPTLVTLPFVLLLLDYWPLRRMQRAKGEGPSREDSGQRSASGSESSTARREVGGSQGANFTAGGRERLANRPREAGDSVLVKTEWSVVRGLVVEKIPLFLLSAASCIATILAQKHALEATQRLGLSERITNALISYVTYLSQMIYPRYLAVFYPYPTAIPRVPELIPASLFLAFVSVVFIRWRNRYSFLVTGWLWYLGMLVPMIGLIQVGSQSHADRYTYLTQIGLYIVVAWGSFELSAKWRGGRFILSVVALVVVTALTALSRQETASWQNTETLWRHAIANTYRNAVAYNNLGNVFVKRGQLDEAIGDFRKAIEINGEYPEAYVNLGNALMQNKSPETGSLLKENVDEAISNYQKALAIKPQFAEAESNLGNALFELGQTNEAVAHYRKALSIKPDLAEANGNLADVLLQQGAVDEAIAHYDRAIEEKRDYAEAYCGLGNALFKAGKLNEAIGRFQKALVIRPVYAKAHNNLGIAFMQSGEVDAAIAHFAKAIEIAPAYAQAQNNLGDALLRKGEADRAIIYLQKALEINPDYPEASNDLGSALMSKGQISEAIGYYEKAVQIQPNYAEAHNNLATALLQNGKIEEAISHYKNAVTLNPDSAEMQCNLGNVLIQKGKLPEAIECYRAAVRAHPELAGAHNKLGTSLGAIGKTDEALEQLSEALRINPNYADAHYNLGHLMARLGRREEAITHLSEALRLKPGYADAKEQLRQLGVTVSQ